jgi:hypothetical protein
MLPQPTLDTASMTAQTTSDGAKILYVWITEQDLTSPQGVSSLLSGFTANHFTGGATSVEEYTFIDTANGLWGGTALASQTFTGLGSTSSLARRVWSAISPTGIFPRN